VVMRPNLLREWKSYAASTQVAQPAPRITQQMVGGGGTVSSGLQLAHIWKSLGSA